MSAWSGQGSRHARGYGAAWVKLREQVLKRDHYLCRACMDKGRVTSATEVDHVVPKAKGGTDDLSNLASLCEPCHTEKTIVDRGHHARPRRRVGLSGWPIED